jgi:hypothetical protein
MKSMLSTVIGGCLIASLVSGCATGRGPRQINDPTRAGIALESNWSRVSQLAPGAELMVTTRGSQPRSRHFVVADELALIVLNLTLPALPTTSTRVLREMASQHPEYFAAVQKGGTLAQADVRIGRDGLFVANSRIADLEQVVERFARNDVSEIRGPVVARGSVIGAVLGGWIGFAVGAVPALGGGAPEGVGWLVLTGSVAVGASLGHRWSSHETEGLVYRAP